MLSNKYKLSTRGLQTSISRFSLSAGSGSVSRLFLAIMSLAFAAQRLFYRPLWLFFLLSRLPAQCEKGPGCNPSLSSAPSLPPPFPLSSPGGTDIQPVCTDDLRYHRLRSKWIYSFRVGLDGHRLLVFIVLHDYLSSSHSRWHMPQGPMINGETWLIIWVDGDCDTQRESGRL